MLRPAFSHGATFMWFLVCMAGLSVRHDNAGVTSIVRALSLDPDRYYNLLRCCHSKAIKLHKLGPLWAQIVLTLFGERIERVNGHMVFLADGKNHAKSGKKMPAVKLKHQSSDSNTKPQYIMAHSTQCVSVLAKAANTLFSVPLKMEIHEGLIFSNRDQRTLLDKLLHMIKALKINDPFYLVADAYYSNGPMIKGLLKQGNHLISRAKRDFVAYHPAPKPTGKPKRGRPQLYGKKVKLINLFHSTKAISVILSPVYGEKNVLIRVRTVDLLWKPAGGLVRFVLVDHPTRGKMVLLCTDLTLEPSEIIRLYGLRFKIELAFKQASQVIGAYGYHFWMMDMKPLSRRNGNQHLHLQSARYREAIKRKMHAYHVFLFMGVVTQGLMQYLSACHTELVWQSFGSWLRTIRKGVAPSELVVSMSLRNTLPEFLIAGRYFNSLAKFIINHQAIDKHDGLGFAA